MAKKFDPTVDSKSYSLAELKEYCRSAGLKVSGNKKDLYDRLTDQYECDVPAKKTRKTKKSDDSIKSRKSSSRSRSRSRSRSKSRSHKKDESPKRSKSRRVTKVVKEEKAEKKEKKSKTITAAYEAKKCVDNIRYKLPELIELAEEYGLLVVNDNGKKLSRRQLCDSIEQFLADSSVDEQPVVEEKVIDEPIKVEKPKKTKKSKTPVEEVEEVEDVVVEVVEKQKKKKPTKSDKVVVDEPIDNKEKIKDFLDEVFQISVKDDDAGEKQMEVLSKYKKYLTKTFISIFKKFKPEQRKHASRLAAAIVDNFDVDDIFVFYYEEEDNVIFFMKLYNADDKKRSKLISKYGHIIDPQQLAYFKSLPSDKQDKVAHNYIEYLQPLSTYLSNRSCNILDDGSDLECKEGRICNIDLQQCVPEENVSDDVIKDSINGFPIVGTASALALLHSKFESKLEEVDVPEQKEPEPEQKHYNEYNEDNEDDDIDAIALLNQAIDKIDARNKLKSKSPSKKKEEEKEETEEEETEEEEDEEEKEEEEKEDEQEEKNTDHNDVPISQTEIVREFLVDKYNKYFVDDEEGEEGPINHTLTTTLMKDMLDEISKELGKENLTNLINYVPFNWKTSDNWGIFANFYLDYRKKKVGGKQQDRLSLTVAKMQAMKTRKDKDSDAKKNKVAIIQPNQQVNQKIEDKILKSSHVKLAELAEKEDLQRLTRQFTDSQKKIQRCLGLTV